MSVGKDSSLERVCVYSFVISVAHMPFYWLAMSFKHEM